MNKVNRLINQIENHKYISIVVFIGIILISLSTFTDSMKNIIETLKSIFTVESLDERQLAIINAQLRPVYFDLEEREIIKVTRKTDNRCAELDTLEINKLDEYSIILKGIKCNYTLLIEGHTNRINLVENIRLAKTRVNKIADYLINNGIPSDKIKTISYGGETWTDDKWDSYKERVEFKVY